MAMAREALRSVLQKSLAQDRNDQLHSISFLEEASKNDLTSFTRCLSDILANVGEDRYIRQAAGLQLKNVLVAKDAQLKQQCIERWLSIPENVRRDIQTNVLRTIGTETATPSIAAQCVAAIAFAELPRNSWPDCVIRLTGNVTNASSSESLKAASLEALGYMCQDLNPHVLADSSNAILTAIVHGMRQEEQSTYVRLVATEALNNSLEFTRSNFENEYERNVIMQVVCNCTQSDSTRVKVLALQCLVKIVSLYYEYMEVYMKQALFAISVEAMKSDVDEVVLQGIEFWSNVCDEEIDLALEADEAAEKGTLPAHESRHYAKGALVYVLPILLEILPRQEENDDEEEWVPSKAAGVCVMLLAQCVGDDVVRLTLPFIASNYQDKDWRRREAALMAFGSILDGPNHENLLLLVREGFSIIVDSFKDERTAVRDTAAWAVGRVCEFCWDIVSQREFLDPLLHVLCNGLSQEPRVAANICWSVSNLATSIHQDMLTSTSLTETPETSVLSSAFETLVSELFKVTDRRDAHQSNLRIAAYEALMELIKMSPMDCYKTVQSIVVGVMSRLDHLLGMGTNVSSAGEQGHYDDLQALLCATLQTALRRLEISDLIEMSDNIMILLLRLMGSNIDRSSVVIEEALMACTVLIEATGKGFLKYFDAFKPFVIQALTKTSETQVCIAAVGVVDDLSRGLEKDFVPHMTDFMTCLIAILTNPEADKNLKCVVMSVFGDIALVADTQFVPFLPTVVQALMEALAIEVDVSDFDQVDYINALRQNCIETFTSLMQSLRYCDVAVQMLHPYAVKVIGFIAKFGQCPEVTPEVMVACAGALGDLAQVYAKDVADELHNPGIVQLLRKGRSLKGEKASCIFSWTMGALSKLVPTD
uniref:Importin N-terminal domain-containing protein n=1 Tax=Trichuris muris TaxID=70415 RepID=A0A5S6Q6N0_TRIMR